MKCKFCNEEVVETFDKLNGEIVISKYPILAELHKINIKDKIKSYTCVCCCMTLLEVERTKEVIAISDIETLVFKCERCGSDHQVYLEDITGSELKDYSPEVHKYYSDLVGNADNHLYGIQYCPNCKTNDYMVKRKMKKYR